MARPFANRTSKSALAGRARRARRKTSAAYRSADIPVRPPACDPSDTRFIALALRLAKKGCGSTSPNPMVGAVVVRAGRILGTGWHHKAGMPHAEIEAMRDAERRGHKLRGATLYVTLEPCSTTGRTPPCTEAIIRAGIAKVIAGATDPNPKHAGKGFDVLRKAGIPVKTGVLEDRCTGINEAFNHWITRRTPFVTVKAAMTLDGKIATPCGSSKWITSEKARAWAMRLRQKSDAIIVGINTVLADDPALTVRGRTVSRQPLRIVLDAKARTPLQCKLVSDEFAPGTLIVTGDQAPRARIAALKRMVTVVTAPALDGGLDLSWLLRYLGERNVTSLLVEGGGEANASFLLGGFAHRVTFFYAPMVLGGKEARKAVGGIGVASLAQAPALERIRWRHLGPDLMLEGLVKNPRPWKGAGSVP